MRTPFFLCYIALEVCALIRRRVKTEVCEDYLIKWDQRFVREGIFLNGRHGQLITLEIAPKPDMQIFPDDKTLTLTKQHLTLF